MRGIHGEFIKTDRKHEKINSITREQLIVMLMQENSIYCCQGDYLSELIDPNQYSTENNVTDVYRQQICVWCYNVADFFGVDREVVSIAMNFFDRYLSSRYSEKSLKSDGKTDRNKVVRNQIKRMNKGNFQLIGVSSLLLASKIHDIDCGQGEKLEGVDLVRISNGQFDENKVNEMEQEIITVLRWRLNPPTVSSYIIIYLDIINQMIQTNEGNLDLANSLRNGIIFVIYEIARYFAELSVSVYYLSVHKKPSSVAFASILIAIDMINNKVVTNATAEALKKAAFSECSKTPYLTSLECQKDVLLTKSTMCMIFQEVLAYSDGVLLGMLRSLSAHPGGELGFRKSQNFEVSPVSIYSPVDSSKKT